MIKTALEFVSNESRLRVATTRISQSLEFKATQPPLLVANTNKISSTSKGATNDTLTFNSTEDQMSFVANDSQSSLLRLVSEFIERHREGYQPENLLGMLSVPIKKYYNKAVAKATTKKVKIMKELIDNKVWSAESAADLTTKINKIVMPFGASKVQAFSSQGAHFTAKMHVAWIQLLKHGSSDFELLLAVNANEFIAFVSNDTHQNAYHNTFNQIKPMRGVGYNQNNGSNAGVVAMLVTAFEGLLLDV
jgi:hypothetical protein